MMHNIKQQIENILRRRDLELFHELESVRSILELSKETRQMIVDVLLDELMDSGLQPNSEPNTYGLIIENLIDACALAKK